MTNEKKTKSYEITKADVYSAWLRVKKNKGGAGIDGVTLSEFEMNLPKMDFPPFSGRVDRINMIRLSLRKQGEICQRKYTQLSLNKKLLI